MWIVETKERYSNNWQGHAETETKTVGVYTNKEDAIRNAKMSFKKMDMYNTMYDEADDTFDRNAKKMKRHGGVLCKFEGEEGEAISVEIRRANFNKDYDDEDGYSSDKEEEEPEVGGVVWNSEQRRYVWVV